MAEKCCGSNCKDPNNRSKNKNCVCGGHNAGNAKKNLKHNATNSKLKVRKARKEKQKLINSLNIPTKDPVTHQCAGMKKYTDEEIQNMSMGKVMVSCTDAVNDCIEDFVIALEKNGKITKSQRLLHHLRDHLDAQISNHWVW